ncbi:GNAT family N-acetyltransferase [Metabacillus schmidteae]|uniref:GNAT family N-acetyltransferase n=1 Tax=Metabacillus schmidteae TaxID=2730405 RepID=UPI00158A7D93|nr:GNAT family N-acetyltransferase [Metabacillus schmidteae]
MKKILSEKIDPSIRELLSFATSYHKIDQEYEKYLGSLNRILFGLELKEEIVGCIGVEIINSKECVIKHIAVSSKQRGKGIGSKMITFLTDQYPFITAETDKDAVDFYRKYGFFITSLVEKYPGVERFLCEYRVENFNSIF